MCEHQRKFIAIQEPGNAGAWTVVEIIRKPVFVVSDGYQAHKLMRDLARGVDEKEGRE